MLYALKVYTLDEHIPVEKITCIHTHVSNIVEPSVNPENNKACRYAIIRYALLVLIEDERVLYVAIYAWARIIQRIIHNSRRNLLAPLGADQFANY